jgi:hypothetical protein
MKKCAMDDIVEHVKEGLQSRETVEKILALPPDQQETLINQILNLRSEEASRFLVLLAEEAPDKKLRKLIKKAVFLLRTQGIAVDEPGAGGESVLKKVESIRETRAFLSNYDPEQTRAVVTVFELKKNQFLFSHGVLHFSDGLSELRSFPVGRSDLDSLIDEYILRTPRPMVIVDISAPYAGYLLEEASRISGKESEEARSLSRFLSGAKGDVRRPSDIHHLVAPTDVPAISIESALNDEVFEPFFLQWSGIENDQAKLAEVVNPSIVLPPYVIQERRGAFLRTVSASGPVASKIMPLKRMLEDTAYLFYRQKQFDRYSALIEAVIDPQSVERVLLHFIGKTLDELARKAQEQRTDMIVDPHSLVGR